ncbi:MAG TPA: AAA-like domain-containing protein, partial [Pseudomonadota bacterium]|nr:AAA-like domain-containing protein [Pseudomonadota bacterium]
IDQTTPYLLRLNLDRFSADAYVSLDSFVQEIASHLAAQFAVLPGARRDLMTQTLRVWRLTPQVERRLDAIIEQIFLQRTPGFLYLALDRLDAVKDSVFQDAFFAIIRGWMDRKDEPLWGRLRLLMATSMAPAWMAKLPTSSPFVITPPLVIDDFKVEQLQHLARLHDLPWDEEQLLSLMDLIGGHPYLTRMAMYTAVAKGYSVEQLVSPERPGVQVFDGFLETCRLRLIAQPGLWPTAQRVLRGKPLSALDRLVLPRLERMGIVRLEGETCTVRYPLYLRLLEI